MKIIQSAGGPFIGFAIESLQRWSGSSGKSFIGEDPRFNTDYKAATYFANGRHKAPSAVAIMNEYQPISILISMPLETFLFKKTPTSVHFAQIDYADPDWNIASSISTHDFDAATFEPADKAFFSCQDCKFILFDAAYAGCDVGDDHLIFELDAGDYALSAAQHAIDKNTGLILYKIEQIKDDKHI